MMVEVHQALLAFWRRFGVPVYLRDHVPKGAAFPFITIEIANASALRTATLTAFDWHRAENGVNPNAQRAEMLNEIAEAIPEEGQRIRLANGFLILRRSARDFQIYYDDPEDESIIGGRTSYDCTYYNL